MRLIDADSVLSDENKEIFDMFTANLGGWSDVKELIDSCETVQGRSLKAMYTPGTGRDCLYTREMECSFCHETVPVGNYCCNCGCKMINATA